MSEALRTRPSCACSRCPDAKLPRVIPVYRHPEVKRRLTKLSSFGWGWRVRRRAIPARLGEFSLGGASVTGSGILETAIRLQVVSATIRQLSRGELAGRAFKTLDHNEASDFASEKGVQELGIIAQ